MLDDFGMNLDRPTPQSLIEAIVFSIRERGIQALDEAATIERLSRCDERALAHINSRISGLIEAGRIAAEIEAPPSPTETINV